jgi:CRP-like cAMP-binding protein
MDNRGRPGFDLPRFLSTLPLFHDLGPEELVRMAEGCTLRRLARGEAVFRVGEPCEHFHIVAIGQVKLFALSPSGQEKVIELIGPGSTFAEALMFNDQPYIVNAEAVTDALVFSVGKAAVLAEIERDPRFGLRMLAGVSRRLHGLVRDVESYTLHSGAQRIVGYLLRDVADGPEGEGPVTVTLPVSKAMVASRLSLTPEYFSRVLHELEAQGLVEIDRRDIRIRDPRRLAQYQLH